MKRKYKGFFILMLLLAVAIIGNARPVVPDSSAIAQPDTLFCLSSFPDSIGVIREETSHANALPINPDKKKKLISAMLAFPFPFGFMGAHRVMLGSKPWVPVVYVVTFGGCFGVLPLIDFIAILSTKDISKYENNSNVFMWVK